MEDFGEMLSQFVVHCGVLHQELLVFLAEGNLWSVVILLFNILMI